MRAVSLKALAVALEFVSSPLDSGRFESGPIPWQSKSVVSAFLLTIWGRASGHENRPRVAR